MTKYTFQIILFALLLIVISSNSFAQTSLVRKEWSATNGLRDTIPYSAT